MEPTKSRATSNWMNTNLVFLFCRNSSVTIRSPPRGEGWSASFTLSFLIQVGSTFLVSFRQTGLIRAWFTVNSLSVYRSPFILSLTDSLFIFSYWYYFLSTVIFVPHVQSTAISFLVLFDISISFSDFSIPESWYGRYIFCK